MWTCVNVLTKTCNTDLRLNGLMVSDLLTDLMVWKLSIPVVWWLIMKLSRKLSVTGAFRLAAV
jgi:hypothetical protein